MWSSTACILPEQGRGRRVVLLRHFAQKQFGIVERRVAYGMYQFLQQERYDAVARELDVDHIARTIYLFPCKVRAVAVAPALLFIDMIEQGSLRRHRAV